MLVKRLRRHFDPELCIRGDRFVVDGHVDLFATAKDARRFTARVFDSCAYTIGVDLPNGRGGQVILSCSCADVVTNGSFCSHIWAALHLIDAVYSPWLPIGARPVFKPPPPNDAECSQRSKSAEDQGAISTAANIDAEHTAVACEDDAAREDSEDWEDYDADAADGPPDSASHLPGSSPSAETGTPARRPSVLPKAGSPTAKSRTAPRRAADDTPEWRPLFELLAEQAPPGDGTAGSPDVPHYVLEAQPGSDGFMLHVRLTRRAVLKDGRHGPHCDFFPDRHRILNLPPADRHICLMLAGAASLTPAHSRYVQASWPLPESARPLLLPLIAQTGRLYYSAPFGLAREPVPLKLDEHPWELDLLIRRNPEGPGYLLKTRLRSQDRIEPNDAVDLIIKGSPAFVIQEGMLRRVDTTGASVWLQHHSRPIRIRLSQRRQLISDLVNLPAPPQVHWPEDWRLVTRSDVEPRPELSLTADESRLGPGDSVLAEIRFHYDDQDVSADSPCRYVVNSVGDELIERQPALEQQLRERLFEVLGSELSPDGTPLMIPIKAVPDLVRSLLQQNWTVTGNRKPYRRPGNFNIQVCTGVDWFDVELSAGFDGQSARIDVLLRALQNGERFVTLGDGSMGLLPEDWLKTHGFILQLGRVHKGRLRFSSTQVGLLDALLDRMPGASFDGGVVAARRRLKQFDGIKPAPQPVDFAGQLRDYQREGLGWGLFLHDFGWGGCLADDMGLGKTIQVLALLLAARTQRKPRGPALVVVPRSTVGNWLREAERFAPALSALNYTGPQRKRLRGQLPRKDLIITTYGTMRRDIELLAEQQFGYVVLDEAQAIKNPRSQNAKAARLLKATHRLALTGTPIENHIGDLWSIFEFITPGLLGDAESFHRAFDQRLPSAVSEAGAAPDYDLLRRLIRPFVLRRTKGQVAGELPPRVEQTIECALPPEQRAFYQQLRDHLRSELLERVEHCGLANSKIHILEALLRLRQAACHAGLVDKAMADADSGKLETLLPMLRELIDEGHKALVFSQFTQLLAIVRNRLQREGIVYEYLDGSTSRRQERIDRFQQDAQCPVFLISLKAGGVGLNLTAADYVFILDPWWNPAVEAQAIDRAHRIGQIKKVNAYRLIARDTVESRISELQASKRQLAEAIITADNTLLSSLSRDDLTVLFS